VLLELPFGISRSCMAASRQPLVCPGDSRSIRSGPTNYVIESLYNSGNKIAIEVRCSFVTIGLANISLGPPASPTNFASKDKVSFAAPTTFRTFLDPPFQAASSETFTAGQVA